MKLHVLATVAVLLGISVTDPSSAQAPSRTGLTPTRPIVGGAPPPDEAEARAEERRQRVDDFLESVTTSDAIIEVVVGTARILTTREPIAREGGIFSIATGDPTTIDFEVLGPRLIRVLGTRVGNTDLTVTLEDGESYSFDIHVIYDLDLLRVQLRQIFPDALIKVSQMREHIILQGQARSTEQVAQIVQTVEAFLLSAQTARQITARTTRRPTALPGRAAPPEEEQPPAEPGAEPFDEDAEPPEAPAGPTPIDFPEDRPRTRGQFVPGQIINLIRVPGVQQVMLKVQVAELNRTALRRIGADIFIVDGSSILGTQIAGASASIAVTEASPVLGLLFGQNTTGFGIFDSGDFQIFLAALRANTVASILAEPNLVTMNGHEATFLAGGEFPVPVPQASGGTANAITIQFKEFGVLLNFVPTILDDQTIRLRVAPEVSEIDEATAVIIQGFFVPGLRSRRVNTTVELKQGQTLAMAGLLQVELDANTSRIPGLGDLPYIGPLFSNTSHQRVEKELLVMVTPQMVSPMDPHQVPPLPGSEIMDPNDLEFYLLNRIEGRTGRPFRSTTAWDDPLHLSRLLELERRHLCGPVGYSE